MTAVLLLLLHGAVMLGTALLLAGVMGRGRAWLQGRAGPPLAQPLRVLQRLARKPPVLPAGTSWLFAAAPGAALAPLVAAALLLPSFTLGMATAPAADLLVVAGLLALSRCVLALAAYEGGTGPGGWTGQGGPGYAAPWPSPAALAEPALLLVVLVLALSAGGTNLDAIGAALREGGLRLPVLIAVPALALVGLADAGRLDEGGPPPGPALDHAGRSLALLHAAGHLRLLVWLGLVAAVLPWGVAPDGAGPLAWLLGLAAWGLKLAVLTAGLLLMEAGAAMAPAQVPGLLGAAALLALLAALLLFASQGFA